MRLLICVLAAAIAVSGCRAPYMAEVSDMVVQPDDLPTPGMTEPELVAWFEERGYVPGPRVRQSEAELRRRVGDPLVYAQPGDQRWWLTVHRTVRHACVTKRSIYYSVTPDGRLERAIYNHRSQC